MTSIDEIIQREINPFESLSLYNINFWQERQDPALNVGSIHQDLIASVETVLDKVAADHRPQTLMLMGDSGSGKSYLLGRVKQLFNSKAFFVYIDPWPDSDYIWRHLLRQTVDCLMKVPEGKKESQLLLWLKSLLVSKKKSLLKKILGERKLFVKNLKASFPFGIYKPNDFFSALYYLLDPKMRSLACEWLRGDDLDEEDLHSLRIKKSIDSEDAAQKMMASLGRFSISSLPIVLCFDNLDNIPRISDESIDLQALFNINSSIHSSNPQNFLIIISIITNTWNQNKERIQPADIARVNAGFLSLKPINLEQGEALLAAPLHSLHSQAESLPPSPIFPLSQKAFLEKYPRKKALPRNVLEFGRKEYQEYKRKLSKEPIKIGDRDESSQLATFNLVWQDKYNTTKEKITKITQLSGPQLIKNLQEALAALEAKEIKEKLLAGKYAAYSFSYQEPVTRQKIGVLWTEERNLTSFCAAMKASQAVVNKKQCQVLYLIRNAGLGKATGYKIYGRIFNKSPHYHLKPSLESIHYLATYHSLVNAALANELVVEGITVNLEKLQSLIRESEILNSCTLLQDLGIVRYSEAPEEFQAIKEFLFNLVKTQSVIGRKSLLENASSQFKTSDRSQINILIQQLFEENKIKIIKPKGKLEEQLVCYVPE
ncbi:MAG: P-loop NTPase fold protein [Cyanobacteriota bacterium]|nr:P-loop NTPase fold protein [Cyanobacteriota bacterium]